jgi:hypothetical protein
MKTCVVAVALLLVASSPSYAIFGSALKVYVYAAVKEEDTFQAIPRTLTDSALDLQIAISGGLTNGLAVTHKQSNAAIVVQVTSREEVQGEYRVHVHVTTIDGHAADLTGTSTHQWKLSADDLIEQLANWAHAHHAEVKQAQRATVTK